MEYAGEVVEGDLVPPLPVVLGSWSKAAAWKRRRSNSWVMNAGLRISVELVRVSESGSVGVGGTKVILREGCFARALVKASAASSAW